MEKRLEKVRDDLGTKEEKAMFDKVYDAYFYSRDFQTGFKVEKIGRKYVYFNCFYIGHIGIVKRTFADLVDDDGVWYVKR